jgi:hypothetical protein
MESIDDKHPVVFLLKNAHKTTGGLRELCPAQRYFCRSMYKTKKIRFQDGVKNDGVEAERIEYANTVIDTFNNIALAFFKNDLTRARNVTQNLDLLQFYIEECERSLLKFDELEKEMLEESKKMQDDSSFFAKIPDDCSLEENKFFSKWLHPMYDIASRKKTKKKVVAITSSPCYTKGSISFGLEHRLRFLIFINFLKDYQKDLCLKK